MAKTVISNNPQFLGLIDMKANIVFSTANGEELALQMVKPMWQSGGKGFPLVVFIQGSGWTKPNQFWEIPQLARLAARGFVIASVTHRSCWDAPAPAFLKDVKTALRYLLANSEEYDIDSERVCAWGTSSGGNTALLMGMTQNDPAFETEEWAGYPTKVKAVVDCFGPTDLNKMIDSQFAWQMKDEDNLLYALGGKNMATYKETLKSVSPIAYVEEGKALPPILILHGDADELVLYEDSVELYDKLIACGHQADFVQVTGAPHEGNFWSPELLNIIFDFIEKHV